VIILPLNKTADYDDNYPFILKSLFIHFTIKNDSNVYHNLK